MSLAGFVDSALTTGPTVIILQVYDPLVELGEEQGEDPDCVDGLEKLMIYINNALEDDGVRTEALGWACMCRHMCTDPSVCCFSS